MTHIEQELFSIVNTNADCRELERKLSAISAKRRRKKVRGWRR